MLTCLMRLTLFVPGLLLPREILADTTFDLTAPALSLLLGRGRRQTISPDWLEANFGFPTFPAAALRKVGAGGTADGEWICLDPVHFDVRREGIMLADPARLDLTADQATELIAAIQPLFAEWGEISASAPNRWELRLARPPALETRPLAALIDRPVPPGLPGGTDGREWRRLLAEAQTALHAHPLNRQREAAGRPTVSSLWPWGQGRLPATASSPWVEIWCDDPVIAGLSALTNARHRPLPDLFGALSGDTLAILPSLQSPAAARDALGWRAALQAFERHWLAPSVAALRQGACDELQVVASGVDDASHTTSLTATRGSLRRFWRRPRPLTELA